MISNLRNKIRLCSQKDVVTTGGELKFARDTVLETWAGIRPYRGSMFNPEGAAMRDNRNTQTHEILIRYRPDIEVSAYAWIYEIRLKSAPRWFKVLNVTDGIITGSVTQIFRFGCRIVERGDDLLEPDSGPAVALPKGVQL